MHASRHPARPATVDLAKLRDTLRERMQAEHVEKRAESGTWFVVIVILCFLAAMLVPHWGV